MSVQEPKLSFHLINPFVKLLALALTNLVVDLTNLVKLGLALDMLWTRAEFTVSNHQQHTFIFKDAFKKKVWIYQIKYSI